MANTDPVYEDVLEQDELHNVIAKTKSCSEDHVRCSQEPPGSVNETVFLTSFSLF